MRMCSSSSKAKTWNKFHVKLNFEATYLRIVSNRWSFESYKDAWRIDGMLVYKIGKSISVCACECVLEEGGGGGRRVIQEIPTRSFSYASYDSHFVRRRIKLIYSSAEQCAWPVDMICVHTYTCIYVYIYMRNVLYILLHYHDVLPYDFRYYIMCDILTAHTRLNHARDINFS